MKRLICLTAALLVAAPLVADIHEVEVTTTADGKIVKDVQAAHADPELEAGDQILWKCSNCPNGAKLEVLDIDNVAILDLLPTSVKKKVLDAAVKGKTKQEIQAEAKYPSPNQKAPYKTGSAFLGPPTRLSNTQLLSGSYRAFDHDHLWKFTWKVTYQGQVDTWDPHFRGHKKR